MILQTNQAYQALLEGKLIIYPTDTVYGIGCTIQAEEGFKELQKLKPRSSGYLILVDDWSRCIDWIQDDIQIDKLTTTQPTTWIFNATKSAPKNIQHRSGTIAIRKIDHQPICDLIKKLGEPIISSSANHTGEPTPDSLAEIMTLFPEYDILAGENGTGIPSQIIRYINQQIIR